MALTSRFSGLFFKMVCFSPIGLLLTPLAGQDTCTINDWCESAILLDSVFSDQPFSCFDGCTVDAAADPIVNACGIGDFPTVWYKVKVDQNATLLNIIVRSLDMESPSLSLFRLVHGCSDLQPILMTSSRLPCILGSNGMAEALGTAITPNATYYIAVTAFDGNAGHFELCLNTIFQGSLCVTDRHIEIVSRSFGGSLLGPFNSGETVEVCLVVDSFTAAGNGCQWFQGLIPVFGNGWDPSSFDPNHQPLNTLINGTAIGMENNGLYGAATWDWFADVDYHYDNSVFQIGDFDGNGRLDMCNTRFDPNCMSSGGITGGCCGPCWGSPIGTLLPPGWFSYGINGTCPTPGPPIRVDWGDGNSCGAGMGPWRFCFDLKTQSFPECADDSGNRELSIRFFTFSDGEVGSWTGSASVCALDQMASLRLPFNCSNVIDLGEETLQDQCEGIPFQYQIYAPDVAYWTWEVTPAGAGSDTVFEGENGYWIQSIFDQSADFPYQVTYSFSGIHTPTGKPVVKQVKFTVWPQIQVMVPDTVEVCKFDTMALLLQPDLLTGGSPPYLYTLHPGLDSLSLPVLFPPWNEGLHELTVTDALGCYAVDSFAIKFKNCGIPGPYDEHWPPDDPTDPKLPDGRIIPPDFRSERLARQNRTNHSTTIDFTVFPIPVEHFVLIKWTSELTREVRAEILNTHGQRINQFSLSPGEGNEKQYETITLPPGVYFIRFSNEDFQLVRRMVKL